MRLFLMEAGDDKQLYSHLEKGVTVGLILKRIHLWNLFNANYIWNKRKIGPSDNYTAFLRRENSLSHREFWASLILQYLCLW